MVAGLIDEPYCLSMDQVAKLTMRQVSLIYYRERNKKTGVPKRIDALWGEDSDKDYRDFMSLGLALGKSPFDLQRQWEEINVNSCS